MNTKTVDDLLQEIHVSYEGDTDYLEFEDEEVQLRVFHIKRGIEEWNERFPESPVTIPTTTTSVVEIPRPEFVVHYVLWKIFGEDDPDRAKEHFNAMGEEERRERVELAKTTDEPNKIKFYGAGFGDTSSTVVNILTDQ